jgi:hypothetical protein
VGDVLNLAHSLLYDVEEIAPTNFKLTYSAFLKGDEKD